MNYATSKNMSKLVGRYPVPGNKTVERARRCGNCKHFENEELSKNHWKIRKQGDIARLIESTGSLHNPLLRQGDETGSREDARFGLFDTAIRNGKVGICMVGGVQTDFVVHTFLCDKWTGKDGHSVVTSGFKDKLSGELKD